MKILVIKLIMNYKISKDSPTSKEHNHLRQKKLVLGSMLISKEAIPRAMSFLTEESFLMRKNKIIYRNIMQLFDE